MSLITLRSTQQDNGATVSQSASNFTNHFKEGIVLGPGNTVELVSMSIVKLSKYEVIQGLNDTFIWRIGAGSATVGGTPVYSQHVVRLVPGSYNGVDLASHIQEQLNNSTLLGVYRGQWTCTYTSETSDANAKFTINYGQNPTPSANGENNNWIQKYGSGSPFTLVQEPTANAVRLRFSTPTMGFNGVGGTGYGFHSDRGIFSNGGKNEIIIKPVELLNAIDFIGAGNSQILNYNNNPGFTVKAVYTQPALPNGWMFEVQIFNGNPGYIYAFDLQGVLGEIDTIHTFNGGSGYVVGDEGSFTGGSGSGATYKVTAISAGGGVTSADITNPGQGYQPNDDLTFSGKGDGLSTCKVNNVKTGNDGTGYAVNDEGDLVYATPGAGSGINARYRVNAVGVSGEITDITIINGGQDYAENEVLICSGQGNGDGKIRVTSVDRQSFIRYGVITEAGEFGLGTDKTVSSDNTNNWNIGAFILNGNTSPRRLTQIRNADGSPVGDNPMELETETGGGYNFTTFKTYPSVRVGYAREQLVNGDFTNSNAVYKNSADGMDCQLLLQPNDDHTDVDLSVFQLKKASGINYPVAGWRTAKIILQDLNPTNWGDMPQNPTDWSIFTYGDDAIRVTLQIDGNRNIQFSLAHDTNLNNVFVEEQVILKTGDKASNSNGKMDNDFDTTIREILYPLHGILFVGGGTPFSQQELDLTGIYDTEVITKNMELRGVASGDTHTESNVHEEEDLEVGVEATPLTLSAIYKMGVLTGTDIYNGPPTSAGPNQISDRDVNPNIANINLLLGLERGYTFQSGQQTNAISTNDDAKPNPSLSEPALHVELPDFNIKSYSGQSSDTGRAIAVIPKEQWTTDELTGVLHFQSQYPIPIDLNLAYPKPFYELTARLRQPDGQIADDLINPTEITVKIGETEESRQSRVMMKAMERLGQMIGNAQDNKISSTDPNIPLL